MAHKWLKSENKRVCKTCRASQALVKSRWRPLAGRCSDHSDGRPPKTRLAVMCALEAGESTPFGIAAFCGLPVGTVRNTLTLAKRSGGLVENIGRGCWRLTEHGREYMESKSEP